MPSTYESDEFLFISYADIDIKPEENEPEPELVGLMEADRVSLAEDLPQGDVAATSEVSSSSLQQKIMALKHFLSK